MEIRRAPFALLLIMAMAAVAPAVLKPEDKLSDRRAAINLEQAVPASFGDWTLDKTVTPVSMTPDQDKAVTEAYDQLVSHSYVNPQGQRVMLALAYGSLQKQGLRAHRQEVCYAAQGFSIHELKKHTAVINGKGIALTQMVAVQGTRIEPVTYWFTMGNEVVSGPLDKLGAQLRYSFSGLIPDGYIYRVSTVGGDVAGGFKTQENFTQAFIAALPAELKLRLLGMRADDA